MELPKEYAPGAIEEKWMNTWQDSMYYFDWDSSKPQYIIDTPPPYPTGNFHIGNALNWCYIDFVARYKRMRGFNVMFPEGWDCHGLPTEVKVEEIHGITKSEVSRQDFRRMCVELTEKNIASMRKTLRRLAFSIDWSNEYITMTPEYYGNTQRSFVRMYEKDLIYQQNHPVNWCPRCETAIAFAEVEYDNRTTFLNYMNFDYLKIATTRPELLAACVAVAVNPEDERYGDKVGSDVTVPVFGHKVKIIADKEVDPSFGTGVVMICTFGDKQDVRWWAEHSLPLRKAIDKTGKMTGIAGKYAGMSSGECKKAIIEDMKNDGIIYKQEELPQNVGQCWRCKTPIEIISEKQWFVKIRHDEILKTANEITWVPDYMKVRLENWTETMEWDWCISRQRIFATPIPVWYCKKCGKVMVAKEEWLPLDPTAQPPPEPCECGSTEFKGEPDVLDTWMDSSVSALNVAGWLKGKELRLPAQLRPQGYDIIRTWSFYTILRSKALTDTRPWDTILINGMVLGEDGHKMSKSLNNFVMPEEVVEKYGSDAFRQWAAVGGTTGSDIMFSWKDVVAGSRYLQKLWSIIRFSMPHISGKPAPLTPIDRWLLSKLNRLVREATAKMDAYQFDETFKAIRGFSWEILADNYIELSKSRLYGDGEGKQAAQYTLFVTIDTLTRLLAPFLPYFSEEVYSYIGNESVHAQGWPEVDESLIDEEAESTGELIKEITASIRRYKSEHGIALNAPLGGIEIYSSLTDASDIAGATNSRITLKTGKPDFEQAACGLKPDMKVLGKTYRSKAKAIVDAMKNAGIMEIVRQAESGSVTLHVDGEDIILDTTCFTIEKEVLLGGKAVDVLEVEDAVIVITR
ncbi:MAG: valine--tRNA ligase [Candidatus Methanoperedens sp.]|jgi:valyl-tRNA synthetase|nr:valine--tRNA ligase [Candidatus Methanoperedens sp.]PKL53941.1 MAG: valine--tRNA ligase [Candidatus Methanoperedenaceae archaeon HGW-Methanoperedenaceae-1]